MPDRTEPLVVTALAASAQLGGTERVLLDFANRAFEHEIALRVLTPVGGPLVEILNKIGVPAEVVPAPRRLLRGSQQEGHLPSLLPALWALASWSRRLKQHRFVREADVVYTVAFKTHLAATLARLHPVVWHLHEFPPETTGWIWKFLARRVPDAVVVNSVVAGEAWVGRVQERGKAENRETRNGKGEREKGKGERDGRESWAPDFPFHVSRFTRRGGELVAVPNGVNLDRFRPRERTGWIHERLGIPGGHRLVGMPAVFARWKGHLEVIEAFQRIAEEFPDVHLVIVGGSIYDTVAEREYGAVLRRAAGGDDGETGKGKGEREQPDDSRFSFPASRQTRVHLLPFQREIELAFVEFDLAVHYSLRPEPFGRVVLEAMACGVPVVAADEGGPVEILGKGGEAEKRETGNENRPDPSTAQRSAVSAQHSRPTAHGAGAAVGVVRVEGGWLVRPRDVGALAEGLREALSLTATELRAMGEAGRRRAEDHYSARRFAARLATVLWEVRGVNRET